MFCLMFNKEKWYISISSYFYLAFPFYILIYFNNHFVDGKIIIFWTLCIVWTTDTSAYVFGSIIKGKKLYPSISPNKTWSGFYTSLIMAATCSSLFSFIFNITNFYKSFFIGLLIGIFNNLGDLFESYLKRINEKKDSSKLIPGHGGLLDRLDGFLFAIVIIYIIIFLLWE